METMNGKGRTRAEENARLDELIEDATVDCYNESEQIPGLFTMMEENLVVPFKTTLLGIEVTVDRIDLISETSAALSAGAAPAKVYLSPAHVTGILRVSFCEHFVRILRGKIKLPTIIGLRVRLGSM